jgi:hypothetical protein
MRPGSLVATAKFLSLLWARTWQKQGRFQFFNRRIFDADVDNAKSLPHSFCAISSDCPWARRIAPGTFGSSLLRWACRTCVSPGACGVSHGPAVGGSASGPDRVRRRTSPAPACAAQRKDGVRISPKNLPRGLSTHSSITAEVAPGSSPRPSILHKAEIRTSPVE